MMKPYYQRQDVTLYHADCLDVIPLIEPGTVDAVVTDPPYGINLGKTEGAGGSHGLKFEAYASYEDTYENFCSIIVPRLNASIDIAKRGLVWTGPHIHEQRKPSVIGGVYVRAGKGRHCWGFKTFLPFLLYGKAPDLHLGAPFPTVIEDSEQPKPNGHPCPKPLGWMVWNVNLTTRKGGLVFDPFTGSGTTAVACVQTGRRFIGCEIEERYCQIVARRCDRELDQGRLFDEPPPPPVQKSLIG